MAPLVDIIIFSMMGALVVVFVYLAIGYFYGNIVLIGYLYFVNTTLNDRAD